ncbi:MAG TPA: ribosome biogenesis factor YjgA [Thiobacillaceae bacterium]|nr:ribosome biogenesis factor YjgA [Thiobacillaceae bacterium]HNU65212.1 ribosome biogenesis factor YjgA [Thiobacillaceae bacterium]
MQDEDSQGRATPSKSQRKREASALQDLGGELVRLSAQRLERMDLPDALRSAVLEARRLASHGAMRRQMQRIGKLMRAVDAAAIAAQLAEIRGESNTARAAFHALEHWRDQLLRDDQALTRWLALHPHADAQQLHRLIRNARKEHAAGQPPRSSRALFRMLRQVTGG